MKKLLSLFAVAMLVATPTFAHEEHDHASHAAAPYTVVDAEAVKNMMGQEDVVIIDSRGGKYFDGEVIKGAKQLSAKETNAETLAKIAPNKDTKLVFYCSNTDCPASKYSAVKADKEGYKNLYKYPGGIADWKEKGLPVEKI